MGGGTSKGLIFFKRNYRQLPTLLVTGTIQAVNTSASAERIIRTKVVHLQVTAIIIKMAAVRNRIHKLTEDFLAQVDAAIEPEFYDADLLDQLDSLENKLRVERDRNVALQTAM